MSLSSNQGEKLTRAPEVDLFKDPATFICVIRKESRKRLARCEEAISVGLEVRPFRRMHGGLGSISKESIIFELVVVVNKSIK